MGCDYYIETILDITFYDSKKDWTNISTDKFRNILNTDKRLYRDLNNVIKSYYLDENFTSICLDRERGYFCFDKEKTYEENVKYNLEPIYKPEKIYECGKGWDFEEDCNEDTIENILEQFKNVEIIREKDGFSKKNRFQRKCYCINYQKISIDIKDVIEIWIRESRYERL
jgi:hypothetical protein